MKERNSFNLSVLLGCLLFLTACGSETGNSTTPPLNDTNNSVSEQQFIQVSWLANLENSDGSKLKNLAGYNIYLGHTPSSIDFKYNFDSPHLTEAEIGPISTGNYYLSIAAYTTSGVESTLSESQLIEVP